MCVLYQFAVVWDHKYEVMVNFDHTEILMGTLIRSYGKFRSHRNVNGHIKIIRNVPDRCINLCKSGNPCNLNLPNKTFVALSAEFLVVQLVIGHDTIQNQQFTVARM